MDENPNNFMTRKHHLNDQDSNSATSQISRSLSIGKKFPITLLLKMHPLYMMTAIADILGVPRPEVLSSRSENFDLVKFMQFAQEIRRTVSEVKLFARSTSIVSQRFRMTLAI